jgi:hypothetical protein
VSFINTWGETSVSRRLMREESRYDGRSMAIETRLRKKYGEARENSTVIDSLTFTVETNLLICRLFFLYLWNQHYINRVLDSVDSNIFIHLSGSNHHYKQSHNNYNHKVYNIISILLYSSYLC